MIELSADQLARLRQSRLEAGCVRLVGPVTRKLQVAGLLPDPLPPRMRPLVAPPGHDEPGPDEKASFVVYRAVKAAVGLGVSSTAGVAQLVSYFVMVSPTWHRRPEVAHVLGGPGSEDDRLMALHELLQG